jgi:succinate dehydrogenase / fumarate reductase cytochrome b subunit
MSGVINIVLFVGLIYLYWLLPDSNEIKEIISMPSYRLVMWVAISAFLYHFLAGVRHIYMDFLHQHSLGFARYSSMAVLIVALLLAGWVGVSI